MYELFGHDTIMFVIDYNNHSINQKNKEVQSVYVPLLLTTVFSSLCDMDKAFYPETCKEMANKLKPYYNELPDNDKCKVLESICAGNDVISAMLIIQNLVNIDHISTNFKISLAYDVDLISFLIDFGFRSYSNVEKLCLELEDDNIYPNDEKYTVKRKLIRDDLQRRGFVFVRKNDD